jgi:hypothetical protein
MPLNVDDQVIPALTGNGNMGPSEYAPGEEFNEEDLASGEAIAPEKRAIAEPLIGAFGE